MTTTVIDNNDRSFSIAINLSGVSAATGDNALPEGYYRAVVTDMYVGPEKPNRVVIKVRVSEGANAGTMRTTGINIPTSADDKVRAYWRALLESVGYTAAQLDNGQITLGADAIVGRTAHIYYMPKDEEAGVQYDRVNFYPPASWADASANFQPGMKAAAPSSTRAAGGAAPSPTRLGGAAPAPAVTPAAESALGSAVSRSSILNRLAGGASA